MALTSRQHRIPFRRCRFLYVLPCFVLFSLFVTVLKSERQKASTETHAGRHILADNVAPTCIPPSIDSFPQDFMTQDQRMKGGVVVHFLILLYFCGMLAVVCDDYFVPSLDVISRRLRLPSDVAGATFMAIGTSSPELYSSIIGSFITEGDIGIGTIVGSAVFNILGATALAGFAVWNTDVHIDWYPVTRDCSVYVVTVAALTIIISNNYVTWWEALIMLVMFGMYIVLMYFNTGVEKFSHKQIKKIRRCLKGASKVPEIDENSPLLGANQAILFGSEISDSSKTAKRHDSYSVEIHFSSSQKAHKSQPNADEMAKSLPTKIEEQEDVANDDDASLCSMPKGAWKRVWWVLMWPTSLLFFCTIPDCRKPKLEKFFLVTFLLSTVWLGLLSYVSVWMVTIIGYTLSIPDTVSGLTILAVGTSLPEIVSSVIIVRCGLGNMVMSNLIGSNIFDILFCLGAPWFVKTLISEEGYLYINSSALTYTSITLLATIFGLLVVFHVGSWKLNRKVATACLLIYGVFITLSCMYELNVFGYFNPPPCPRDPIK